MAGLARNGRMTLKTRVKRRHAYIPMRDESIVSRFRRPAGASPHENHTPQTRTITTPPCRAAFVHTVHMNVSTTRDRRANRPENAITSRSRWIAASITRDVVRVRARIRTNPRTPPAIAIGASVARDVGVARIQLLYETLAT